MTKVKQRTSRRAFCAGTAAVLLARRAAAQPAEKSVRLAFATSALIAEDPVRDPATTAFLVELRRLGYQRGRNLLIDRWDFFSRPQQEWNAMAREIVATRPDVIYVRFSRGAVALKAATSTIPIVFQGADPIGWGLGETLARPGANVTGFAVDTGPEFYAKVVQLLRDTVPHIRRMAYLTPHSLQDINARRYADVEGALGIALVPAVVDTPIDGPSLRRAIESAKEQGAEAIVVGPNADFYNETARNVVVQCALELRLPAIAAEGLYVRAGLLMAYDVNQPAIERAAAGYIDRILKGVHPAELPFQQQTRFNFIVNLKTARALSIELPFTLQGFVTEYIE